VVVVDQNDCYVFASGACEAVFGYSAGEMIGMRMWDLVYPEDIERTRNAAFNVASGSSHLHFRNRYVRKDGSLVHIMWSARRVAQDLRIGVARDITDLVRAESQQEAVYAISEAAHDTKDLFELFARLHLIVGNLLPVGQFIVALRDEANGVLSFPYSTDGKAESPDALDVEKLCATIVTKNRAIVSTDEEWATDTERAGYVWIGVPFHSQRGVMGALVIRNRTDEMRYTDKDKELLQFISTHIATAAQRKQADIRLQHLALHDVLTGLPNRELFYDRLTIALARAQRNRVRMALLYIDLNGFKQVNDQYGHATGDVLLREASQRLKDCVREADTVSRFGGDEFVVVLDCIQAPSDASRVAETIRAALKQDFEVGGHELHISPSIGVAIHPEHGLDADALMRHADAAMYEDKAQGKTA
jgi:diguanylate cyclase (GGDEF)-like protein/PAS domain S-box-containing protein